ncbi:peptidyl-tRNA hydrolase [Zopfia rhizophila CBS 207.26]|uniref:peptidyl-tRNA hydrolase n=1 Tax=Zopfia rhizophila CBS 207.26 TaxID=1314779 RepID=A0A6A6E1V9_9PEZI|nr:peptidyl-tRNA hydrolase [Zopfia rhizophila CBS 207.26]
MANTQARAHVVSSTPISRPDDPDLKNNSVESDEQDLIFNTTTPQSRKAERKAKKNQSSTNSANSSDSNSTPAANESSKQTSSTSTSVKQRKPKISIPPSLTSPMPPGKNFALLVCSLGNPTPTYTNTLHSAGHTILSQIQQRGLYQPFHRSLAGGLTSTPNTTSYNFNVFKGYTKSVSGSRPVLDDEDDFTLWQSPSLMNVSGKAVAQAWKKWSAEMRREGREGRLVVVHDELESALGKITVKDGGSSARGHNGLKSCQASLGGVKWWRVGIGIGRPESREPNVVANYVLSKMNGRERDAIEGAAIHVVYALREIAEGRR